MQGVLVFGSPLLQIYGRIFQWKNWKLVKIWPNHGCEFVASFFGPHSCVRILLRNRRSASEVTTLWRYTNLFIIIIISSITRWRGASQDGSLWHSWGIQRCDQLCQHLATSRRSVQCHNRSSCIFNYRDHKLQRKQLATDIIFHGQCLTTGESVENDPITLYSLRGRNFLQWNTKKSE